LVGFAVDPNFNVNGYIYLSYVVDRHYLMNFGTGSYNANTNNYNSATIGRVTRYTCTTSGSNLTASSASRLILLGETKTTGLPVLYESHGVGALVFASDGTLLVSTGDAASYLAPDLGSKSETYYAQALTDGIMRDNENVGAFRSQMLNSLCGKILRIDPASGNGISSNPFYDPAFPRSAKSRVWTLGLRNPFRMCIRPNTGSSNPATGDIGEIYVTDVGLDTYEEMTIVKTAATNCGWPTYEGLTPAIGYASAVVYNKDEPNPLYGISGCTQQFFPFNAMIKQATADEIHTVYNPCNPSIPISGGNDNRFFHRIPAIDWKHYVDSSRVAVFSGNTFTVKQAGTAASGITGNAALFNGNTAVSGCFNTGNLFPPSYYDTYFMADYTANWIKNIKIQFTDRITAIDSFEFGFPGVVHMCQNPMDGSIFVTDLWNGSVNRISYGGNFKPVVKMSSDKTYGPSPLSVNFTGNTSYDPDGPGVTYSWNFGDGTALSTSANPSHNFTSGNSLPKKFVVKLTVKDNLNATSTDSIIISINNTPPNVNITSPVKNSFYQLGSDTLYSMQATVVDAEHRSNELSYLWQTLLRHNNHYHPQPSDTNKITTDLISRIGCNGDDYYWLIKLTVTDAAGLSSVDSSKLFPQCGGPLPLSLISFSVSSHRGSNLVSWVTANEVNLKNFEIERSYDGSGFVKIASINARMTTGNNNYSFTDDSFLDGYIYYRLKIIDIDGKFSNSYIVRVYSGSKAGYELTISPNPFKNEFLFGAVFSNTGKITIRIIDAKGATVKIIKKQVEKGFNSFQIDKLGNLSKGIYFLEVEQDGDVRKIKLIRD
jgi:glucose/arabinose dehydrogenase